MPSPVDIYVGSKLKNRRIALGLSQAKIGKILGVTFQQIQKYEKGINRIGSSRLYELSTLLLVPISYFFDEYETTINKNDENNKRKKLHNKSTNAILLENVFIKENHITKNEVILLVKYFTKISNPLIRHSVISLSRNLSMNDEKEKNNIKVS